jgi:hypothetical protein
LNNHYECPDDDNDKEYRIKDFVDFIAVFKIRGADIEGVSDLLPTEKL